MGLPKGREIWQRGAMAVNTATPPCCQNPKLCTVGLSQAITFLPHSSNGARPYPLPVNSQPMPSSPPHPPWGWAIPPSPAQLVWGWRTPLSLAPRKVGTGSRPHSPSPRHPLQGWSGAGSCLPPPLQGQVKPPSLPHLDRGWTAPFPLCTAKWSLVASALVTSLGLLAGSHPAH